VIVTLRPDNSTALLRTLRASAGLTQRQLADRMGKPQSMIARWELGHDVPRLDSLVAIATACGVTLDMTLRGHDDVDRAQIREHLRLTPTQRLENVENVAAFIASARRPA
jgi:transcriptional regulator with XRE-family HTH domain